MSAVTFTRVTQTLDRATGRVTPSRLTYAAACVSLDGHHAFRLFGLITSKQITVVATTLPGVFPPRLGDTFAWLSENYTVKDTRPLSLNGVDTIDTALLAER